MLGKAPNSSSIVADRRFRGMFGVSPETCASLWNMIGENAPSRSFPTHLLWALLFLKCYATEHVNSVVAGVDEKTFRKWSWTFVGLLSDMKIVSERFLFTESFVESTIMIITDSFFSRLQINWDKRLLSLPVDNCWISLDGTDFRIQEPTPFDPKWFSHKFKGPGLRYEIGVKSDRRIRCMGSRAVSMRGVVRFANI